jgi:hypothetical protein
LGWRFFDMTKLELQFKIKKLQNEVVGIRLHIAVCKKFLAEAQASESAARSTTRAAGKKK